MITKKEITMHPLSEYLTEYKELNSDNKYKPVAVGRYGIRTRESIYSKELAKDYAKNRVIFKGTLTVGMGSVQMDIGILSDDNIYSVSPAYHTYKIYGIDFDYLRYCLQCRNSDMFVRFVKRGSRQGKSIDLSRWVTYKIPVYPTVAQCEIVERLDTVQSIISTLQKQIQLVDDLVKARFVELFGDPETNPMGWEQVTLEDVCSSIVRGPFGSALKKEFFVEPNETTYKVYEQKHAIQKSATIGTYYVSKEKFNELKRFECVAGDILMSCSGTMGELYQLPEGCERGIINQALCKFTLNKRMLPICFLIYMRQTIGNLETKGSGIQNIAAVSYVKAMPINLPPMDVQKQFSAFVAQVDKSKTVVQKALDEAQLLFDSLMQQYFG